MQGNGKKVIVSKPVADAINKALSMQYFNGNKEKFLEQHQSTLFDPWGPALSALNGLPYEQLESALHYGFDAEGVGE